MWVKIWRLILQVIGLWKKDQADDQAATQQKIQEVKDNEEAEKAKVDSESGSDLDNRIDDLMRPPDKG